MPACLLIFGVVFVVAIFILFGGSSAISVLACSAVMLFSYVFLLLLPTSTFYGSGHLTPHYLSSPYSGSSTFACQAHLSSLG